METGSNGSQLSDANLPPGAAVVLSHPSGSTVCLVGVAHVSAKAAKDAEDCITAVQPAIVVLELDQGRHQTLVENMEGNDPLRVLEIKHGGVLQPLKLLFGGRLMEYGLHTSYAISGALLGVWPGEEFRASIRAAERVGAEVVLGDRDQAVTMKRLSRAALLYNQRPGRTITPEVEGREQAAGLPPPDSWESADQSATTGPQKPDEVVGRMMHRWNKLLLEAGCSDPPEVLLAFKRILTAGSMEKGSVAPEDVLIVRNCGQKLIENYREKAIKEGDTALDMLEVEALREVGASTGMLGLSDAMTQVILRERDAILAHRLWEAADRAAGRPVVGVVGAGHVQGILRKWQWAGTPDASRAVAELNTAPSNPNSRGNLISTALLGTGFAYLGYKRPRIAMGAIGVAAFATLPYMAAMIYTVNRWGTLLENVIHTTQELPDLSTDVDSWGDASRDTFQ